MSAQEPKTILNVARYIVENISDGLLTPLKLQKLVYYCQAWHLVWQEKPLFKEDFQAWANGPVNPTLYSFHKGAYSIDKSFLKDFSATNFTELEKKAMNAVIKFYGDKEPFYLSELTHQEAPWLLARKTTPAGAPSKETITKDSMLQYYGSL